MTDGVIKYKFDFKETQALKPMQYESIEKLRSRLYALGLIGIHEGIGYGNISQKNSNGTFIVTGTQTGHLNSLQGEHYAFIEEYDDREFYLKSSGMIKPSSESLTHGTIYNLHTDIKAVIHIHSQSIWKFMLQGKYLKTENVAYGTQEMIDEVNRIYRDINPLENAKFVMSGHEDGVIIFGRTLEEAEINLYHIISEFLSIK
ncbi:MAG: class II aldolase/adducin family protein [Campylobacterota bacterium]|nr:class II aldolase/adducin family protein [Campylobacterota bacterium]